MARMLEALAASLHCVLSVASLFLLLALTAGCGQRNAYVPPPPPDVLVAVPQVRAVTVAQEFTGNTQASEAVQIRARVSGYLQSVLFVDGTFVSQGESLFVVDPRPYVAQFDMAKAELRSKEAIVVQKDALYKRTLSLLASKASTREEADIQRGDWLVAQAAVGQAEANLRQAQLNLEFTHIRAPISGKISRRLVDPGNLVVADNTLLTTITRYDPMYVYFTVSEADYLSYMKRVRERTPGTLEETIPHNPRAGAVGATGVAAAPYGFWQVFTFAITCEPRYPLELGLGDEQGFPHTGYVDFADNTVDPNTGTLLIRGVFRNPPPYYLAPGMFVRIRAPISVRKNALLVPDKALGTDQAGPFLLVVNRDNVVEHRAVTIGALEGSMRVIEDGLQPGERFVVEGLQRARPGSKINPLTEPAGGK